MPAQPAGIMSHEAESLAPACSASRQRSTASEDLRVKVVRSIYVPNIFSPDGDGVNDIFLIHSKNPLTISYWQIFDRWGSLVFERHDIKTDDEANGWNPISLGRHLAAGVYTWIAEIKYPDGKKEKLIGDVTLLH